MNELDQKHTATVASASVQVSRSVTGWLWLCLVISIVSSTFLYALDNTILANVRPDIIQSFGDIEKLPWISVAYALGEVGSNPIWGKLYGKIDNKILFCTAVATFDVGTAICGAAPNTDTFIAGRVIAGIGGSGIYIGNLNIFSSLTLVNERAAYLSYVGAAWCLGTILGPIIGGAFAVSAATWRWSFYINLCISGVTAPIYLWVLPRDPSKLGPMNWQKLKLDYVGAVLYMGAAVSLITAISFGGVVYPWKSKEIVAPLVLSVVLWVAFGVQQKTHFTTELENRLFPVQFFASLEMCLLFAETAIGISCVVVPIYFIPLFFQFIRGEDALAAGVHTLPFVCAAVVGCLINGALFEKFSIYFAWFAVGSAFATLGGGLLISIRTTISDARVYGFSVLLGLGGGLFAQAGYAVGQARQPREPQSYVTAFLSCAQMAGVALSLAIGTSIFSNQSTRRIAGQFPQLPHSVIEAAIAGADSSFLKALSPNEQGKVLEAINSSIRDVFVMVAVVGASGFVMSFVLKRGRLFPRQRQQATDANWEKVDV